MRQIVIEKIAKDPDGRLLIAPSIAPDTDYNFIWRAASSVRWDAASRSLFVLHIDNFDTLDYVRQVVAAVKNEYGDHLIVSACTVLTGLQDSEQQQIQHEFSI